MSNLKYTILPALLWVGLNTTSLHAQDLKISGQFNDVGLREVFRDLERRYDIRVFYRDQWLPEASINHQFTQLPLDQAFQTILENTGLSFVLYGKDNVIVAEKSRIESSGGSHYIFGRQPTDLQGIDTRFPILAVGDSTTSSVPTAQQITLYFKDEDEESTLDGVIVYFEKYERTINSDIYGQVTTLLPAGVYQMEARRVGYQPFICNLRVYSPGEIEIKMSQEAIELMEVVVSGEGPEQRLLNPQTGIVSLTPKQIKEMPSFLGEADVIKTIQTLPGVTTIGEGAPGYFVRGGNIDQNLILQDGVIFPNASHALGFFSMFNPDLISQVQLFKGNIPAQYGGRLSSVLDVRLKGNNYTSTEINGGVGTVMSKLSVETPLIKDKVSLLAGGRVSYADWILPVIKIPEVQESDAFFYDFNVKLSSKLSDKGSIAIGYFQSFDRVSFEEEAGFEWSNKNISFDWTQEIGQTIQSQLEASKGDMDNLNFDPSGLSVSELKNGLEIYKVKENINVQRGNHQLILGGEWINYRPKDETLRSAGSQNFDEQVSKGSGRELGVYLNDSWEVNENLALSAGLRVSIFWSESSEDLVSQDEQYTNLEPRVSFRYGISQSSAVKISYNRISQYLHLLSNTTGVLPVDQWITSNSGIKPSISNNFSIGYFRNFRQDTWESSVELFFRRMTDIIEFKDFADLILNPQVENEILQGDGRAHGVEFFLKRHSGKVRGNLSYTFSRTFVKVPLESEKFSSEWFPAKFDRPHNFNLVMDWTINRRSRFGLVFNFTSGRPITAPVSSYNLGNIVVPHYGNRNEFRIPNYHRLDLSYTYKRNAVKRKRYQDSITFSLYNVYGRRNAFSVFFRKENNQPAKAYRLSVLGSVFPSVTYTFTFK